MTRPEKQMVRVRQDDLSAQLLRQVARRHTLHRRLRTDRHEDRRFDHTVSGVKKAGARTGLGTDSLNFEADVTQLTIVSGTVRFSLLADRNLTFL
jgi:hypothetical protein